MAGISSLGIGSGLDLSGLVENILAAERAPKESSLNRQESALASSLTGYGLMKSAISSFQSSIAGLGDASSYSTRSGTNSDTESLNAVITNDAGTGSYNIEIDNLATNQSLASDAYSSLNSVVGEGTIDIRFGTITGPGFTSFSVSGEKTTQTITVDSTNNTLSGLRDEINSGDYGVTASIINDGTGYRLTLQSQDSGANNAMEITITDTGDLDDTDSAGLSALAYNATAANLTETQTAEDASVSINGLTVTSDTNVLNEAIEGVTLTLLEETTGTPIKLNISESTSEISEAITSVADAYNEMVTELNELSAVGTDQSSSGILVGDITLRGFTQSMRTLLTGRIDGLTGSITALADVGITTSSNGTLTVDSSKFNSAIANNPNGALALFAELGTTDDSLISFNSAEEDTVAGSYDINVTQLATQSLLTGATGVNNLTVDTNNDEFTISINGTSSDIITLTQGTYANAEDLASEIQSQINSDSSISDDGYSVTVTYDSDNDLFEIQSNLYGSDSSVELLTIDTNTTNDFGLSAAVGSVAVDVAGSIGGVTAAGSGQTLTLESGDGEGISIDVLGGAIGNRGSVSYTKGLTNSLNELLNTYLDSTDGYLSTKEDGLNNSIDDISDERVALDLRIEAMETRLINQFSALDALIANFQTTGNFLAQQIDALPGFDNLNNN